MDYQKKNNIQGYCVPNAMLMASLIEQNVVGVKAEVKVVIVIGNDDEVSTVVSSPHMIVEMTNIKTGEVTLVECSYLENSWNNLRYFPNIGVASRWIKSTDTTDIFKKGMLGLLCIKKFITFCGFATKIKDGEYELNYDMTEYFKRQSSFVESCLVKKHNMVMGEKPMPHIMTVW